VTRQLGVADDLGDDRVWFHCAHVMGAPCARRSKPSGLDRLAPNNCALVKTGQSA
jgi:hypothetical protein